MDPVHEQYGVGSESRVHTPHHSRKPPSVGRSFVHDPYHAALLAAPAAPPMSGGAPLNVRLSVGSMGTPYHRAAAHDASMQNARSSLNSTAQSSFYTSSGGGGGNMQLFSPFPDPQLCLVRPSRTVLKALAKKCRPRPPWCVGAFNTPSFEEEVLYFADFMCPTAKDLAERDRSLSIAHNIVEDLWPGAQLRTMGITAASPAPAGDAVMHFYASGTETLAEEVERDMVLAANRHGAQVQFGVDYRGCPCALLTDMYHGLRTVIRYGPTAEAAKSAATLLQTHIAESRTASSVLVVLLAVVRQMRILNETGIQSNLLSDEALALMLLAVLNSYPSGTLPDAGSLLADFFVTYGFTSHFNTSEHTVTTTGLISTEELPKRAANTMVVEDPYDGSTNLTALFESTQSLQDTFNYCYNAITQYVQLTASQRRAQSALSTILGGEPFWGRVLFLYQQHIEPYYSIVQSKLPYLLR